MSRNATEPRVADGFPHWCRSVSLAPRHLQLRKLRPSRPGDADNRKKKKILKIKVTEVQKKMNI